MRIKFFYQGKLVYILVSGPHLKILWLQKHYFNSLDLIVYLQYLRTIYIPYAEL